jgi:alkylation response protein AidB-like acyl-CoA dehydrogenase
MFELSEEHRMLQDLVAKFVDRELIPLEKAVLAREMSGQKSSLTPEEEEPLLAKCRELGLWGLDVPEEFGGANLPTVALIGVYEEQGRTCVPFIFPPDSPNLHMLMAVANPEQRSKYLEPYARGEAQSAIAISEPGAGGDPAGMITRAVKDGGDWVINGRKIWVSRVPQSDFTIVMARGPARASATTASPPSSSTAAPKGSSSSAKSRCSAASAPTSWCSRIAAFRTRRCSARSAEASRRCSFA